MQTITLLVLLVVAATATPLDDYINKADPSYSYTDTGMTVRGDVVGMGWTGYVYNMTSQTWLSAAEVNRPVWWHWLVVVVPDEVVGLSSDTAMLYITGGGNNVPQGPPGSGDEDLIMSATIAVSARCVGAVLYQVPNQALVFASDPSHKSRSEDAAIAWTWYHFITSKMHHHPEYILELPMTKSAVRALDTLSAVAPKYRSVNITKFIVAGASKRGWTTWLTGAVDKRVVGIIPIVLDALNFVAFCHRQWTFYGGWSFALQDYYALNIMGYLDTPEMANLSTIIDPYYYRDRLTMPKLAVNAGGDEFQMPDDHRYWAHDMPGEMNLLMVKNAEHSMATGIFEILQGAGAWAQALVTNTPRPVYTWVIDELTGDITVTTTTKPTVVSVAYAQSGTNPVSNGTTRDFRWAALNVDPCLIKVFGGCVRLVLWSETTAKDQSKGTTYTYVASMPVPAVGYTAFFVEIQWENPGGPDDFLFTSATSVVPNTAPHADCTGAACKGELM